MSENSFRENLLVYLSDVNIIMSTDNLSKSFFLKHIKNSNCFLGHQIAKLQEIIFNLIDQLCFYIRVGAQMSDYFEINLEKSSKNLRILFFNELIKKSI